MSALLTYALNEYDQLVKVDTVVNGAKCNCRCPHCGKPLEAKNSGEIREHHFAHTKGNTCESAYETTMHLLAKEILLEEKAILLPPSENTNFPSGLVKLHDVKSEEWDSQYNFRPDAEGIMENGERLLIEFYVSHKVTKEKREIIISNHLKCVEIDLNYIEMDKTAIRSFLLGSNEDRTWIVPQENKKKGDGDFYFSQRNPLHKKAIELLKKRFEAKDLWITINNGLFNLAELGYDVCEPISNSFRGFKSDLLLYRSKKDNKGYISLNLRGRRRNSNQKIPQQLRVIDVIVKANYEYEWLEKDNSLSAYGIIYNFMGFREL